MRTATVDRPTLDETTYEFGWWVEIFTAHPPCLYYFGTFETAQEAEQSQAGFVQDLFHEGASGISHRVNFQQQPSLLTISCEELSTQKSGFSIGKLQN